VPEVEAVGFMIPSELVKNTWDRLLGGFAVVRSRLGGVSANVNCGLGGGAWMLRRPRDEGPGDNRYLVMVIAHNPTALGPWANLLAPESDQLSASEPTQTVETVDASL
jgi:hypothetical protein